MAVDKEPCVGCENRGELVGLEWCCCPAYTRWNNRRLRAEAAATNRQQLKAAIALRKEIAHRIHEGISYGVSDESLAEDIIAVIAQRSAV